MFIWNIMTLPLLNALNIMIIIFTVVLEYWFLEIWGIMLSFIDLVILVFFVFFSVQIHFIKISPKNVKQIHNKYCFISLMVDPHEICNLLDNQLHNIPINKFSHSFAQLVDALLAYRGVDRAVSGIFCIQIIFSKFWMSYIAL